MPSESLIQLAAVLLVDPYGRLLLQLRDEHAPNWPNVWGLPGGHIEPGETPVEAAVRELFEETALRSDRELILFERQTLLDPARVKHYFYGTTRARPEDVVLGEGAAMVFIDRADLLDGRPYTPGTPEVLARFLASELYVRIS